ncbi:dynein heavy chain domain-containing protein 1-like [Labrus bergylta]|uniref:dynein heavy chain domain-containing protein 1-like n=1 Tax=Labrus bergylta TaxID=56723 RepID=UPI0033144470
MAFKETSAACTAPYDHDGVSQSFDKDITRTGSKVKKKALLPPLSLMKPTVSAAFVTTPLYSCTPVLDSIPSDRPISVVELPPLVAKVGPGRATYDTKWTKGPRLLASALGTDIPIRTAVGMTAQSLTRKDESIKVTACYNKKINTVNNGKAAKPNKVPLTATEVLHIFAKKRDLGELLLYYLKEVEGDSYRPYDLQVVHSSEAGSEHYIFTPNSVLHVTERGFGGIVSLAEWFRESVLWTALQEIPFFRDFRLQKAFTWWHKSVRKIIFHRRCQSLQNRLVIAVPQFRNALLMFNRIIEDVKGKHLLPQEEIKTYTMLEFKHVLKDMNQEGFEILKQLSKFRFSILNKVRDDCYKTQQELELHMEYSKKPTKCSEPIHLHLAHQQDLKKELAQSESVLKKLGKFVGLINQMTLQSLVTVTKQDAISFLNHVLKRKKSEQGCLFHTKLCFGANTHLAVDPPVHLYQGALSEALLTVGESIIQGNRVHGCNYPLTRGQLEWQISINDVAKQVDKEQAKIMQEAEIEILQLCESYSWLLDINLFTSQWSQASLESMKGQSSLLYEELIKKLRHWTDRICTFPSSVSTSNNLFIIQCTCIKENLVQQLRCIEEDVLGQLVEQIKLLSESLISDLEGAAAEFKAEPRDLHDLSQYALKVRESVKMLADTQKRMEYIHSLQDTVCMNFRKMTDQEVTLEEKMLAMWDCFILLLKQADSIVCNQLPTMSHALDTMFSFLVCDLKNKVSKATSGPFLDPTQSAEEIVFTLNPMCEHVHNLNAKLEQVSRTSQNLQEHPMDMSILTTDIKKFEARKELWELIAMCKTWMEQWKSLPFSEVVVSQAQEKITQWKHQALSLADMIPTNDAVLQETLGLLESLSHQLSAMAPLQSTTLKTKHWKAIFKGMGLMYDPEKMVMVADLMSAQTEVDQKLITKICRAAKAESNMDQTFLKLKQGWEARLFQLDIFSPSVSQQCEPHHESTEKEKHREGRNPNLVSASQPSPGDVRFTIIGLGLHIAEIENDLMTLSTMLKSPHAVECKRQMEEWMQSLQDLGKVLNLFNRYQQIWAFLTKMFHETSFCLQRVHLQEQFQPVDETFKEMMQSLSSDPHMLGFVHHKKENDRFHGKNLCQILIDGLSTMEAISINMTDQLDTLLVQFPRLWFLSDREVIQLLTFHPTPVMLQPFVRKCFKGVCCLEVDCGKPSNTQDIQSCGSTVKMHRQMKVLGFFGSLQEHVTFLSPLKPNTNTLSWLCVFEKQLKLAMVQLMKECAFVQSQLEPFSQDLACDKNVSDKPSQIPDRRRIALPELDLLSEYPLQCLLVTEEVVWCTAVLQAFQESSPVKLRSIKARNSAKLENLGCSIRDGVKGAKSECLVSRYMMICLRALVQMTMNHAQQLSKLMEIQHVPLESSFEWLSLMKYKISEDTNLKSSTDPTCFIDVLGHQLPYDYEYFGPEDWEMVHTQSTDRAILGILLVLTSYRCGFMSGPSMAGKTKTVVHLGKALGRQVVNIQCSPDMRPVVVQRMLIGALQTGAWLLLDSVDSLKQEVLSILGQHLEDIHQSFSMSTRNQNQNVNEEPKERPVDFKNVVDQERNMVLAGKSISARLSYGCVLISSKGYPSEVPESLRYVTRPIALTHPDYRIIAEVMLTSIGFSEARSLSRHLVSLISLAKDSNCLPDFITDDQSCYLVVLQRIISASEMHLQQSVRQREMSDEARRLAAKQPDLISAQNVIGNIVEKNKKETTMTPKFHNSHLSVIQGLMEETAVVKAILSIVLPFLYEQKKASKFFAIFKDTFPIVSQFPFFQLYIEEEEKNHLKDVVTEELQRQGLQSYTETICNALTLYQTIKYSQAVMLLGPSGSGKTTCYSALAGALNFLASNARFEKDNLIERDTPLAQPKTPDLTWNSVDTVVLFPNAMSHEELFGFFCDKRGWQDGAVSKVLRDSQQSEQKCTSCKNDKSDHMPIMKWLVMDGEPLRQPGWLDNLTTLCRPENPFMCLPSCETLLSQSHLKLLMETNKLCDASPSAVTCCSLVYFTGTDLWKAVWKTEMDALSWEHKLDQKTLTFWNRLAEDLFSSTLSCLKEKHITSAIHYEGESSHVDGLQEIMSFFRVIHALLQHFGMELRKTESLPKKEKTDVVLNKTSTGCHTKQDLLARNLFLVAFIWGFSGHLHPRYWPQFDLLIRQALFSCRYKIMVPDEESVFEHFFNIESKICPTNSMLTSVITPKYVRYTFLLNLMLEANQPVLLAGEVGSGKTTVCKTLLSYDKPHISLPASPLLSSRDLRTLMDNIRYEKNPKNTKCSMIRQPRLLLFVDDLHEACDVFGKTSAALETLRQSVSTGEILIYDTYHFKLLSSRCISYMATCCVFGSGNHQSNVISSRLSRLFSIFVLPNLTMDVVFSIHSSRLKTWLKEMPLVSCEDMAHCIITATKNLYDAVCEQFQPTAQRPHFIFSQHDLQKVFLGMCLWQPNSLNTSTMQEKENSLQDFPPVLSGPATLSLNIAHLWMHECMRTFSDRLCSEGECKSLVSLISITATTHYGIFLIDEVQPANSDYPATTESLSIQTVPVDTAVPCKSMGHSVDISDLLQEPMPAGQSDLNKCHTWTEPAPLSEENHSKQAILKPLILQYMEEKVAKLVFVPELSEVLTSVNHNFSCFYQDQDLEFLQQELCAHIDREEEYNEQKVVNDYNVATRCILHRQRLNQLLHILRVLFIPGGHGLLIGSERGTGRKTTVRLAAYLMGYQLMEVHPGNENKLHDILKEARNQARIKGVNVIILAHEGISLSVRNELLVAMAHRTYPALSTDEELRNLVSRVTAVMNSRRYVMDSWNFEKFLSQIHRNVHVFLLLPLTMPVNIETPADKEIHAWNAQLTKALSCSCCVEVYQPWSNQSLVEGAAHCLKACLHKREGERSEVSLPVAMAGIHQSACHYASVHLTSQPFSPQTYMEFIAHFAYLSKHMHKQQQSQANRVATALSHLDGIRNAAVVYKNDFLRLQEAVAMAQQHEKELLGDIDFQMRRLKECVEEENKLCNMEEKMIPVLLSGLKIQNCLDPSDLEEVRHYRDPPDGVVKIMDAICLLFNHPPGWETARQLFGQPNFYQELEYFDHYSLTNEQLQQLGQIVHSPQFMPESVREVSKACESLCQWVQAVYECCCMQHQLLVKQQFKEEARKKLYQATQDKKDAYHRLEYFKHQLQSVEEKLEEQILELHTAEQSERDATNAAGLLDMHMRDWRIAAQELELNNQTLLGDALILAAVISYLGPFGPDTRTELLSKWRELCQSGSIEINPKDLRTSLFAHSDTESSHPPPGFPITVSANLQLPVGRALGVSQDAPSNRMVVKLLLWGCSRPWAQRWPLLADTQQHQDISSQRLCIPGDNANLEKETECGMVICADDPELLDKLDQAAVKGLRVMVTHMERAVPTPQFLDRLARPSSGCCSQWFQSHIPPDISHPNFCLFLCTNLPVKMLSDEIHPSILAQVGVVDLSLSSEVIQELMLTQLLQSECEELLSQQLRLKNDKQLLQKKLVSEEEALMDYIVQSDTSLLQDSDFLPRAAACQEAMKNLQAEIQQLSDELEYHKSLLAVPRQLMRLAADLYQSLLGVSRLSPAYYFSLHGFITVMQEAFLMKDRPLVPYTILKMPKEVKAEVTNRMVTQMLLQYRPLLFKSHVAVLKLLVSLTRLQHNQLCSETERVAFIRGFQDIKHPLTHIKPCLLPPTLSPSTSALPCWIPSHIHQELLCLEKMPDFGGLIASLSAFQTQWQEYLRFPSSTVAGAIPCCSHSHLSVLQRALLWKTVNPDCLEGLAEAMAAHHSFLPGQRGGTEAPYSGNPKALLQVLVKHKGPIILTLPSPSGDKSTNIQPLYLINTLAHCVAGTKQVQVKVISLGALCDRDMILSMLEKAVHEGHWLVFNNCHLFEQWDDKVVGRLRWLISSLRDNQSLSHPCFQLWFITQEYKSCSIPAAIRLCAFPLVCDSPWDLKDELSSSFREVVSIVQRKSQWDVTADNKELLLRCAIFHSVLLQRQSYKYLGQGRIYSWGQDDLLALIDAHFSVANHCHDRFQALHYIAVNLVHGGHVLDSADFKVLESVAETCFSRASPLLGSGPHILSDIIIKPGDFDLSELLQVLEKNSANINEPLMQGFSGEIAAERIKINSQNLNIQLQASQTPLGSVRTLCPQLNPSASLPAYNQARDRLQTLKRYLTHKNKSMDSNAEAVSPSPLRDFLQTELDDLIDLVHLLLSQLQHPVQYNTSTFASLLELTDLSFLERRAELLSAYLLHLNTSDPPGAYRLSAFKNARGFLAAVMREATLVNRKNCSDIVLHFQVLSDSTYPASLPLDAVYLCGLELSGASWDTQLGALQDTASPQPGSLPLVCVKAQVRSTNIARNTSSDKSSPLKDAQVTQTSASNARQLPLYDCPLYLDRDRKRGNWGLADVNIITMVPLHSKLNPVLCNLRRVRVVSML